MQMIITMGQAGALGTGPTVRRLSAGGNQIGPSLFSRTNSRSQRQLRPSHEHTSTRGGRSATSYCSLTRGAGPLAGVRRARAPIVSPSSRAGPTRFSPSVCVCCYRTSELARRMTISSSASCSASKRSNDRQVGPTARAWIPNSPRARTGEYGRLISVNFVRSLLLPSWWPPPTETSGRTGRPGWRLI